MGNPIATLLLLPLFLLQIHSSLGLEAIQSPVTFSSPRWATTVVYDGNDFIYIIGGYQGAYTTAIGEIVRYNISSEEVQVVAQFPGNQARRHGSAVYDAVDDMIYYFGGSDYNGNGVRNYYIIDVKQWTFAQNSFGVWAFNGNTAIWDNTTQSALLFGTQNPWDSSQVMEWSKSSQQFTNLLPWNPPHVLKFDFAVTVWDTPNRTAYIIGGSSIIEGVLSYRRIFKWTAATQQIELLNATLPYDTLWTSGVWDPNSKCAILTGNGYFAWEEGHNALRFCPATEEVTPFVIDNFPNQVEETAAIYVEKLKRIYVVGGFSEANSTISEHIVFIDL